VGWFATSRIVPVAAPLLETRGSAEQICSAFSIRVITGQSQAVLPFLKGLKPTEPGLEMKPGRAKPVLPDSILKGPTIIVVPSGQKRAIARCLKLAT
jgi:hypothetical protein